MKAYTRGLSQDAWSVLGAWFAMGQWTTLTFSMQENRPSERAQKALDECVAAGVLTVEPFNKAGGVTYRPAVDIDRRKAMAAARRAKGFRLTEPIT